MPESSEVPSEVLEAFVERLIAFRQTLPPEQQILLDTLLIAALRPEWLEDVEPYWAPDTGAQAPGARADPGASTLRSRVQRSAWRSEP